MCNTLFESIVTALIVSLSPYISDSVANEHLKPSDLTDPVVQTALKKAEEVWDFRSKWSTSEFVESGHGGPRIHLRKYSLGDHTAQQTAMLYLPGLRTFDGKAAQFAFDLRESLKESDIFISDLRNQGLSRNDQSLDHAIDIHSFTEYQDDYEDMIEALIKKGYTKIIVVAHSTGAAGPTLNLLNRRKVYSEVKRVFLLAPGIDTSPDLWGRADNFGRLSVSLLNSIMRPFLPKATTGAKLAFGYKPSVEAVPGLRSKKNNSNAEAIWVSYFLKLMALSNKSAPFDQPHSFGPTMNWVLASGQFAHQMIRSTIKSNTPISMYLSHQDFTVNPKASIALCKRSTNCQYFVVNGLHDLPFERPEISTLFRHEIEQALR